MPWKLDRIERVEAIVERCEAILDYLRRERFSTPRGSRIAIDWRIAHTSERLDHFRSRARVLRHNRRMARLQTS